MFSLFAEQGLNWGWVGGFECQSGQGADITLLHSPYVLIVSRSRTARRRRRRRGKKKKKSLVDSLTTHPCGEVASDVQMGHRETRQKKQTRLQTDRKLSHRGYESGRHTNRQRDRQASCWRASLALPQVT